MGGREVGGSGWWVVTGWTEHPWEPSHTTRLWQKQNAPWPRDDGSLLPGKTGNPTLTETQQPADRLLEAGGRGSSSSSRMGAPCSNLITCQLKVWNNDEMMKWDYKNRTSVQDGVMTMQDLHRFKLLTLQLLLYFPPNKNTFNPGRNKNTNNKPNLTSVVTGLWTKTMLSIQSDVCKQEILRSTSYKIQQNCVNKDN